MASGAAVAAVWSIRVRLAADVPVPRRLQSDPALLQRADFSSTLIAYCNSLGIKYFLGKSDCGALSTAEAHVQLYNRQRIRD